jgi:hypothetical protein
MVRKIKSTEKTKKFNETLKTLKSGTQVAECILEDENECSGKIIEAHSIQNNKFLNKISRKGYVYYFSHMITEDDQLISIFEEKGRKAFSTFRGFCKKHDKELFQPIEDRDYNGSDEQNFLFAFRAFAKEIHAKKQGVLYYENLLKKLFERNIANNILYDNKVLIAKQMLQNDEITLNLLKKELEIFKVGIKEKIFDNFYTYKIILENEYPIVCNSAFIPYIDANYNRIFNLYDYNRIQNGELNPIIYFNIFPANNKTFILISCLEKNRDILKQFFNSLVDEKNIKFKISSLILNYAENTGFSPEYIDNYFSKKEIEKINNVFMENLKDVLYTSKTQINLFRDVPYKN